MTERQDKNNLVLKDFSIEKKKKFETEKLKFYFLMFSIYVRKYTFTKKKKLIT